MLEGTLLGLVYLLGGAGGIFAIYGIGYGIYYSYSKCTNTQEKVINNNDNYNQLN